MQRIYHSSNYCKILLRLFSNKHLENRNIRWTKKKLKKGIYCKENIQFKIENQTFQMYGPIYKDLVKSGYNDNQTTVAVQQLHLLSLSAGLKSYLNACCLID